MKRKDFIERQKAYTLKRERKHMDKVIKDNKAYERALKRLYRDATRDITETIESLYTRYALSEGIPIEEAKKRISKFDVTAFEEKARVYVMKKDFSDEANAMLKQYNLKMRVSRLQMMEHEMLLETVALADEEQKRLTEKLSKAYIEEVERQAGIMKMPKDIRKKVLKQGEHVINADFKSAKFSDRIWASQKSLQADLERGLTRSLLRGENPKVWARELRKNLKDSAGKATYNANRLAITETSRVINEAKINSFKGMGYEQYIWIAEAGACPICKPYDEKVFKTAEALIGETQPPMHPNCVCSIAAHYEYGPDKDI